MIVCIDCFKLFQTISNKNKTCNGPGSQSESENRSWHHAQTSRRKNVFYILFERIIRRLKKISHIKDNTATMPHSLGTKKCLLNTKFGILWFTNRLQIVTQLQNIVKIVVQEDIT